MKKYILSFLVIGTFGLFIIYQQMDTAAENSIVVGLIPSATTTSPTSGDVTIVSSTGTTGTGSTPPPPVTTSTPVSNPKPTPTPTPKPVTNTGQYKDGQYTGISADAYYGNIQVEAIVSGGKLTDVQFLDYPQDRSTSKRISTQAMPLLRQEAIQAQSANVNTISGATDSSGAFRQSLTSALAQAINS